MNSTAIKSAFSSLTFRARLYSAMVKTAKKGYSVEHIKNRKGNAFIAVRYRKNKYVSGFHFSDKSGKDITKMILSELKK